MSRLRKTDEIKPLNFPVFAIDWLADAGSGHQWVAYCGGGGSAKTGVNNKIAVIFDYTESIIDTGEEVASVVRLYLHPQERKVYLMAALGRKVVRYTLQREQEPRKSGTLTLQSEENGGPVDSLAVNSTLDRAAFGCELGNVLIYKMTADALSPFDPTPLYTLVGHTKSVISLQFSHRNNRLVSSAKDGTARVWDVSDGGSTLIQTLQCQIDKWGAPPPPGRPKQIVVKGCAFCDMEGNRILTVASPRRGNAYITLWVTQQQHPYSMLEHTLISPFPISSVSLSAGEALLALGNSDGDIILFDMINWKTLRHVKAVHELPVMCIASRPYYHPDDKGRLYESELDTRIPVHAISASADSKMARVTLVARAPRPPRIASKNSMGWCAFLNYLLMAIIVAAILAPIGWDGWSKCLGPQIDGLQYKRTPLGVVHEFKALGRCLMDKVLWAPPDQLPPF